MREPRAHELMVLVDRQPVANFTIEKPAGADATVLDKDLKARVTVRAGPHEIGVTFVKDGSSLLETARQPLQSHFNDRRHPRSAPAIDQISMTGPYEAKGAENTPSRRRLFVCRPEAERRAGAGGPPASNKEEACAKTILTTLMRRAYRRPIASADVEGPMAFYREGRAEKGFDTGIFRALSAVLINPEFLFRVESEPKKIPAGGVYRISDSSSCGIPACRPSDGSRTPDDELLAAAIGGRLSLPQEAPEAGAPNARLLALVQPRDQLRRTVAEVDRFAVHRCGPTRPPEPIPSLQQQRIYGTDLTFSSDHGEDQ